MKFFSLIFVIFTILNEIRNSVIGIDLGSDFIKIALKKYDTSFLMVENLQSKTKTPFAIGFKDDERVFGSDAQVKKSKMPEQVFMKMQEFLGKKFDDENVRNFLKEYFVAYNIEEDEERKTFNFKINYGLEKTNFILSTEEIYGMIFRYIRHISTLYSQSEIKDCVVTVPSYFGYKERLAIIQSVEISGLKLLNLITENTGAAISYAMNNRFKKEKTNLIFYNMGSTSTQATLVTYVSKFIPHDKIKDKIIELQYIKIVDETWDENLGGRNFDYNTAKHLIKEFYIKNNKNDKLKYLEENDKNDVNFYKTIEKVLPSIIKYKEILSANKETQVKILGVEDGHNIETTLTRQQFEEISQKDFERVFIPVAELLNRNKNYTIDNISAIEFIGGGNRIPKIKEMFKNYVDKVGFHMNGDDSVAIGTAFMAANLTEAKGLTYNNKRTFIYNYGTNYGIKIKITNPNQEESNYPLCETDNEELAIDCIRQIDKSAKLMEIRSGFNLVKNVKFKHDSDFNLEVYEFFNNNEDNKNLILKYKIKLNDVIIPSILKEKGYNKTMPKIHLKFSTDKLGILSLTADITYEVVTYMYMSKDSKGEYIFKYSTNKTEPLSANDLIDEIRKINSNKSYSKSYKDKLIKLLKDEIGSIKLEPRKRNLEVEFDRVFPLGLTRNQIIKSRVKLNNFDNMDETRAIVEEKRNNLESILYKKREWSESEASLMCGTEEELNNFKIFIKEVQDWYDSEGYKSEMNIIVERTQSIESNFKAFADRLEIVRKRNNAVDYFHSEIKSMLKEADSLIKIKTWIEDHFNSEFMEKINQLNGWIYNIVEEQESVKYFNTPIFTEDEIYSKLDSIRTDFKKMKRIPKPIDIIKNDM